MVNTLIFDFARVLLLPKMEMPGSMETFHKGGMEREGYSFVDYFVLNDQLLSYLEKIKSQYDLYIFTTSMLQNEPGVIERVRPLFKRIFTVDEIGFSKKDPQSFQEILKIIKREPNEVIFIDDTLQNIESANKAEIRAIRFQSNEQLFKELSTHLHVN